MEIKKETIHFAPNVIFIDDEYADRVTFDLSVNFERMLERRIARADLSHWLVCLALDGGVEQGDNEIQVFLTHGQKKTGLENFTPSDFGKEIDGKAFRDPNLGEFSLFACAPDEQLVERDFFFLDLLSMVADSADVKRLMVVSDEGDAFAKTRDLLRRVDGKDITVFTMQPQPIGGRLRQEILGYSLMSALGIHSEELDAHQ
jgi:hypothetical protein